MTKEYAYLRTKPTSIYFALPFSDSSGPKLAVSINDKMLDVQIADVDKVILVNVNDIEWLRQTLDDVLAIVKMGQKIEKQPADQ